MGASLKTYRDLVLERMLDLLWRHWSSLGVPGHGGRASRHCVDPEALLAATCTFGRYDARLFDEMLDWMASYERFINTQRLHTLFKQKLFSGTPVVGAVARFLSSHTPQTRWRNLDELRQPVAASGPLFFSKDGRELPVSGEQDPSFSQSGLSRDPVRLRKHATFRTTGSGSIVLRLRALMGMSARCEILVYLLTHPVGHPREIAMETHYAQKTVHDAMDDLALSQYVFSLRSGRERLCRLESKELAKALLGPHPAPVWINWPVVLGALEKTWTALDALCAMELDPLLEVSQVREVTETLAKTLHRQKSVTFMARPQSNKLDACMQPVMGLLKALKD
jgi:hypothetical protein